MLIRDPSLNDSATTSVQSSLRLPVLDGSYSYVYWNPWELSEERKSGWGRLPRSQTNLIYILSNGQGMLCKDWLPSLSRNDIGGRCAVIGGQNKEGTRSSTDHGGRCKIMSYFPMCYKKIRKLARTIFLILNDSKPTEQRIDCNAQCSSLAGRLTLRLFVLGSCPMLQGSCACYSLGLGNDREVELDNKNRLHQRD
jgi:hypothetical protein